MPRMVAYSKCYIFDDNWLPMPDCSRIDVLSNKNSNKAECQEFIYPEQLLQEDDISISERSTVAEIINKFIGLLTDINTTYVLFQVMSSYGHHGDEIKIEVALNGGEVDKYFSYLDLGQTGQPPDLNIYSKLTKARLLVFLEWLSNNQHLSKGWCMSLDFEQRNE